MKTLFTKIRPEDDLRNKGWHSGTSIENSVCRNGYTAPRKPASSAPCSYSGFPQCPRAQTAPTSQARRPPGAGHQCQTVSLLGSHSKNTLTPVGEVAGVFVLRRRAGARFATHIEVRPWDRSSRRGAPECSRLARPRRSSADWPLQEPRGRMPSSQRAGS
jgi:hypothetical protein